MDNAVLFREAAFEAASVYEGAAVEGVSPLTDAFLAYWRGKRRDGGLPRRADIEPTEITRYLPHAVLLDVVPDGSAFALRTRLIGTHVAQYFGELTGRDIRSMANAEAAERIYAMAAKAIAGRMPALSVVRGYAPERRFLDAVAIYLPLAGEDGAVRMLFVGVEVIAGFDTPLDPTP